MVAAPVPGEPPTFPKARQGYQRRAVDAFAAEVRQRLSVLDAERERLSTENQRLQDALEWLQATYDRLRTAELDERAADIVAAAEQQAEVVVEQGRRAAADLLERAGREAGVITERARQEVAWSKRRLVTDRADVVAQQLALRQQLSSLRELAVGAAAKQFAELPELSFADDVADPAPGAPDPTAQPDRTRASRPPTDGRPTDSRADSRPTDSRADSTAAGPHA